MPLVAASVSDFAAKTVFRFLSVLRASVVKLIF